MLHYIPPQETTPGIDFPSLNNHGKFKEIKVHRRKSRSRIKFLLIKEIEGNFIKSTIFADNDRQIEDNLISRFPSAREIKYDCIIETNEIKVNK